MVDPLPIAPPNPILNATTTTGLLNVGPSSNPAAYAPDPRTPVGYPDPTKGNVAAVWGYVGPLIESPLQTSSPPITCAVFGQGGVVGANGLAADADAAGDGVIGFGSANGVHGIATSGTGVTGTSVSGTGVLGTSTNGEGLHGETKSPQSAGVYGINSSGSTVDGPGVFGTSSGFDGVHGESQSSQHAGVSGINTGGGYGVWASGNPAGYFAGDVLVTGDVILVNSSGDLAEDFDVEDGSDDAEPGTVLVINSTGKLCASLDPYDTRVAGVVSGAGELKPAIVLQRLESRTSRSPIALVGKAFCKVDASFKHLPWRSAYNLIDARPRDESTRSHQGHRRYPGQSAQEP